MLILIKKNLNLLLISFIYVTGEKKGKIEGQFENREVESGSYKFL